MGVEWASATAGRQLGVTSAAAQASETVGGRTDAAAGAGTAAAEAEEQLGVT